MKLLSIANAKTVKGESKGYLTGILYLAPHTVSGRNVCPMAEIAGCWKDCLNVQGRARMAPGNATFTAPNGQVLPDNRIHHARIRKTNWFHDDRESFLNQLEWDINAIIRKADRENLIPTIRLNGTSDIRWENVRFENGDTIFERFANIQFYDYSKLANRRNLPRNYHLTWSYSEASSKYNAMRPEGLNWAVVFQTKDFPATFAGRKVINGDETDLRFLDDNNVVVGLKAKGSAKHDTSGFVIKLVP